MPPVQLKGFDTAPGLSGASPQLVGGFSTAPRLRQGGERYAQPDQYAVENGGQGIGSAILGELVKSYGFKRDEDSGTWGWSVDNIGQAFKDAPVWTTIDYLTLGFKPASFGIAAARIARGGAKLGRAGAAYQAGEIGLKAATKLHLAHGAPSTRVGRLFSNPITASGASKNPTGRFKGVAGAKLNPDPEWEALAHYGATPAEIRSVADVEKREFGFAREAWRRLGEDAIRSQGKLDVAAQRTLGEALEAGVKPGDELVTALGSDASAAFQKTHEFRNSLHEASRSSGLISEETYVRNLEKYMPRQYEEYLAKNPRLKGWKGPQGRDSFLSRTADDHPELTRVWDQTAAIHQMTKAADLVATQQYAQRISTSAIAKSGDELIEYIERYAANPQMRQMLGITDDAVEYLGDAKAAGALGTKEAQDTLFGEMGWRTFDELFESAKLPEYMKRLPDELKSRYIDPAAADDIMGVFQAFGGTKNSSGLSTWLNRFYHRGMGMFRASKTAYNPATLVRNYAGGIVFHHLTTGGVPKFVPNVGLKALKAQGDEYVEAVKAGILGGSFDHEVRELLAQTFKKHGDMKSLAKLEAGQATAIDFIGDSRVAKILQKGAGSAERFYRGIDEVWKLDAYIELKQKFAKGGLLDATQAAERAALEVNKYMPQFSTGAPVGDAIRRHIPFASFTTEALRVWKNALQTKPHLAFAWTHATEAASYAIGSANGYSVEDINAFREMAPEYTHNKKMMLLPFKVGNRPAFLDMSYLIPMGNLAETEEAENMFFGGLIDPTQNPFLNIVAAASTGKDPFTKRDLSPRFSETQLGVTIDQPNLRAIVGLGEHMLSQMLPPLSPPGFAATNLLELMRGQKHPVTDEPLEPNVGRTVAANLFGMRTEEASVASQLLNARRRERKIGIKMTIWRKAAARARVNGNVPEFEAALDNIRLLREELEPGTSDKYIDSFLKRTEPGKYRDVGGRQLRASYENALTLRGIGGFSKEDRRTMTELAARMHEKSGGRSRRRRSRSRSR